MKHLLYLLIALLAVGCSEQPKTAAKKSVQKMQVSANRLTINQQIRNNLGIVFAKAENRSVATTVRLPGQFELQPTAYSSYSAALAGEVDLKVAQYDTVKKGDLLFKIKSPEWRRMQHELNEAYNAIKVKDAQDVLLQNKFKVAESKLKFNEKRAKVLSEAKVRNSTLENDLLDTSNNIKVLKAEAKLLQQELKALKDHYQIMVHTASVLVGLPDAELIKVKNNKPAWASLDEVSIYAKNDGIIDKVETTDGGWVETGALVVSSVEPTKIRFRASALQSDLNKFKNGMQAKVVTSLKTDKEFESSVSGKIIIGFEGDAQQRTFPIFFMPDEVKNNQAGLAGYLEIYLDKTDDTLAIPVQAVVRDGLHDVFFRRNPKNSDEVLRVVADLGKSDGRWVEVESGIKAGDEVVVSGAYELKLATASATSSKKKEKGHFHADGKWCDGNH